MALPGFFIRPQVFPRVWYIFQAMGAIRPPETAKLIVGILAASTASLPAVELALTGRFGPFDLAGPLLPFTFTKYYEKEMGTEIVRKFFSFERTIDPGELPAIKRWTNELETRFEGSVPRPVNLDPGYVTLSKLVLASTKDYAHRVYVGDGIHAEVTLLWTKGSFVPRDWTYPDYRTPEVLAFFNEVRRRLADS